MRKAVRPRELDPIVSVDPNDARELRLGSKGVELAFEISHAAHASRCVRMPGLTEPRSCEHGAQLVHQVVNYEACIGPATPRTRGILVSLAEQIGLRRTALRRHSSIADTPFTPPTMGELFPPRRSSISILSPFRATRGVRTPLA